MFAYLDFMSSNRLNNYPFRDKSMFGPLRKDFITDALISTNDAGQTYEITSIVNLASSLDIVINGVYIISVSKDTDTQVVTFEDVGIFIKLVFFRTEDTNLAPGINSFAPNSLLFLESCVVPVGRFVTSINGLTGDVMLKKGYNVDYDVDTEERSFELSAAVGAGLGRPPCEEKPPLKGIKTISGVSYGKNVTITESSCIKIRNYPDLNMLDIHNACEPCCKDCPEELEEIEQDIVNNIDSAISDLDSRITALGG